MASSSVLCYGDSNTWGYNPAGVALGRILRLPRAQRWTYLLQQQLGTDCLVSEEGLNSRTTAFEDPLGPCDAAYSCNGRATLAVSLHSHKPLDVVVLSLGANDFQAHLRMGLPQTDRALRSLVRDIQLSMTGVNGGAPHVVLLGPPALFDTPQGHAWNMTNLAARGDALCTILQRIAQDMGTSWVDLRGQAMACEEDGMHLGVDQHAAVAAALEPVVRRLLLERGIRGRVPE